MGRIFKTVAALAATFALGATVTVATGSPAAAASGCDITFDSYRTIKTGSKGKQARAAECLLRSAGYRAKKNGSFTQKEAEMVKKFQKKHKIKITGAIERKTWTALLARGSKTTLRVGDNGGNVKRLQRALTASGREVPVTGHYGSETKAAVKSWQRSIGFKQTGVAKKGVWTALQNNRVNKLAQPVKKKSSAKGKGAKALAFAKKQIGDSYSYGSTGPNAWDCSGLTGGAWKAAGVKLPRTSQAQFNKGKAVSKSNLKRGDLVFFYGSKSHVAIYAGTGKVIHASRPGKPVAYIKMKYMPFAGARRPA